MLNDLASCGHLSTSNPPDPANQTPTHTAVSLRLVAQGAGVGHGGRDGGLRSWEDFRSVWKAQVPSVVVVALHLPFAGIWNSLTLVYVWWETQRRNFRG